MAQTGGQLDFAFEARDVLGAGFLERQQLDGGWPTQQRVVGAIDHPHPAFADLLVPERD